MDVSKVFNIVIMGLTVLMAFGMPLGLLWSDLRHGHRLDSEYVIDGLLVSVICACIALAYGAILVGAL